MHKIIASVLLLIFALAALISLRQESVIFDETAHIPAGLTYLQKNDLRLNAEHPPLVKAVSAIPAWLAGGERPDYGSGSWRRGDQWTFGYELLYGRLGNPVRSDPGRLVVPARSMMVLFGLALGLVVWRWAREMYGEPGGILALALYAVSPTMLAHTRLVTTDLPAALGYTLTLWLFFRYTHRPSGGRAALAGAALGFALITKYSTVLLPPILILLLLVWRFLPHEDREPPGWKTLAGHGTLAVLIAWGVLWAGYGFRYGAVPGDGFSLPWDAIMVQEFGGRDLISWLNRHRLLPEGYLYGLAYALGGASRRLSYFNGELAVTGRAAFFPVAFLLKTPPAMIALLLWAMVAGFRRDRWWSWNGWFLALPAMFYLVVAVTGNLNIGHRHLAPLYPLMFVFTGSLGTLWTRRTGTPLARRVLAALIALAAVSSFLAAPRYLSYFNLMAGGGRGGQRYFVDSSLDWGQGLTRLRAWMEDERVDRVYLAYFGTADPRAYGIDYRKVVMVHDFRPDDATVRPASGDWFAVSKTLLQGAYLEPDREFAMEGLRSGVIRREWVEDWSRHCEQLRDRGEKTPGLPDWLVRQGRISPEVRHRTEAPLLTTWIFHIRDSREPAARIGDSMLVYKIP